MRLHIPAHVRWSDLDAYGHVNNVQMLRLLEEARIRAFWTPGHGDAEPDLPPTAVLGAGASVDSRTFLARQEIEYLAPVPYVRSPLDVQLWIGRLGGASIDICYEVHSPEGSEDVLYARADATVVLVNADTERPRRITPEERSAWEPYVEEPLVMRRR